MSKPNLTAARLREVLNYDPLTGVFTWLRRPTGNNMFAGKTAGLEVASGYIKIGIDRANFRAHRLAWLYVRGEWPADQIDHINRVKSDNRIANLREATSAENTQNLGSSKGRSGLLGASAHRNKWIAQIVVGGKRTYLGRHPTAQQAHEAYLAAKRRMHPFFAGER